MTADRVGSGSTNKEPAKRAQCAYCRYSHRLRKDGTVGRHLVYYGEKGELCRGSEQLPAALVVEV